MTSLRLLSLLTVNNSVFIHSNKLVSKRTLFLSATLNRRTSRNRATSIKENLEKPFTTPIIDLGGNAYGSLIDNPPSVNKESSSYFESSEAFEPSEAIETPEAIKPQKASKTVEPPLPFPFVRLEKNDGRLSEIMTIVKSKKHRKEANLIMLEGRRLIEDALSAGVRPHCFFFSRSSDMAKVNIPMGDDAVPIYKVLYKELKLWSDLVTCPGVIGIFNVPSKNVIHPPQEAMPLTIICDNVRDPGNLGSILRVAAGVGSSKVILTKGCCDMWDTKVLRSSAGAHFRIPIESRVEWSDVHMHLNNVNHMFLADNHQELKLGRQNVSSLDMDNREDSDYEDEEEYPNSLTNVEVNFLRESFSNSMPYFEVDFIEKSPAVIIIGGETHGVSLEALKFARLQDSCCRLHIPLFNSVESLNNGIALSIIVYEMQRQYILGNLSCNENNPEADEQFGERS